MTLNEYLDAQSRRRFVFGASDCVQFGLGWAREATGRPLTAFFAYGSREEAKRALQARHGLARIVSDWMGQNGFMPTSDPEDGDIGLAPTPIDGDGGIAGRAVVIRCGPWWIGKTPKGIGSVLVDGSIPAWRIL